MLNAEVLHGFVGSVLAENFDGTVATPEFHKELWQLCTSDHKNVAIAAPRGHAKSTAVTHAYVLASVLFRERSFVMIVSGTEDQSIQFLGDIKKEIIDNENIRELFGVARIIKDAETKVIVEMDDGHQFQIIAKGSGQKVRGTKWKNKRPDLIVCDDLEEDEQVMNQERRLKFRRWFFGALVPCLSKKGVIRVVGTILHMDSLLERLMPKEDRKSGVKLCKTPLKEYTTEKNPPWKAIRYKAHNSDFAHILWPEMWPQERLEQVRAEYVQQGMPDGYSQEYLNCPIDASVAFFRKDDLKEMTEEDFEKNLRYYAAIDFAISEKSTADYTVIIVAGVDDEGKIYIVEVDRGRWDAREIIDEMFYIQKKYSPELFTAEDGMIRKSIGPFLDEAMLKRNIFININPKTPDRDKVSRARSIQGRLRLGTVKFDTEAFWYPELQQELITFPRGAHDDQVDALAWIGLTLDSIIEAETQDELEDEAWEEEFGSISFFEGRCVSTGY